MTGSTQAAELVGGMDAWSRKLSWSLASGTMIRDRYGVGGGELGQPDPLVVRRAARAYGCRDCRAPIPKGALHGVTDPGGSHYCAGCITPIRPADQFKTKAA